MANIQVLLIALVSVIAGSAQANETRLECVGTEPFWSLKIDERRRAVTYQTPEMKRPQHRDLDHRTLNAQGTIEGYLQVFRTIERSGGMVNGKQSVAVVKKTPCNDGMSDTVYAYEITYIRERGMMRSPEVLMGCCN